MKKNLSLLMRSLSVLLVSSMVLSCSAPLSRLSPSNTAHPLDSTKPKTAAGGLTKAFGDITLVEREQRFRLKIALQINAQGYLIADIFTPFGSSVATLFTDSSGGTIEAPQQHYRFTNDQPLSTLSYFSNFPFTFGEFVHIITGDYTVFKELLAQPDSSFSSPKTTRFEWHRNDFSAGAILNNRSGELSSLKAHTTMGERWEVSFDRFHHGIPREIIYKVDEVNYFMLTWDKIVSSKSASTSPLWQPQ
jgi:hypothetical protein